MRIAVIGTGRMGTGLATALSIAGHQVVFGSRDPEAAGEAVRKAGAAATTLSEAVRDAEIVVLAIPWVAVEETLPQLGDLTAKVVLDITNPYVGGRFQPPTDSSTTERIQEWAPGARVVKGFNHVYAQNLTRPEAGGQAASVMLAGDDAEAKDTIAGLASDIGFDPVDVGPAGAARALTDLLPVLGGLGLGPDRPLKVLRR
jgi:NADPH-dependent F420 reductase